MKIGIVSGCLPQQPGIDARDLYHQLLADKACEMFNVKVEITWRWYITLSDSTPQVIKMAETEKPDILLYHIRPDPYLRISKFYFKYRNQENKTQWRLNFLANDHMVFDKDDAQGLGGGQRKKRTRLKILFRHLNYLLGYSLGVNTKAIARERKVIREALFISEKANIPLILVGPASRPRSRLENFLLHRLERRMSKQFGNKNYINCFGTSDDRGNPLFLEDGIHVNKAGHLRFASLIFTTLEKYFIKN